MLSTTTIVVFFLFLNIVANRCDYTNQNQCESFNCLWKNTTCFQTSGSCTKNQVFINSTSSCQACTTLSESTCTSLCSKYYWNSFSCASCTNIDANCISCQINECYTCNDGFTINSNNNQECLPEPCRISKCSSCIDSTTCFVCITGYKPNSLGTQCINSECTIANCLTCLNAQQCSTCLSGYQLSADKLACSITCSDPNCEVCETANTCTTCAGGYSYKSAIAACKLVCIDSNCLFCDIANRCNQCANNYILDKTIFTCIPVCQISNCLNCNEGPSTCTQCKNYYNLINNATGIFCVQDVCNIKNCLFCQSATTCSSCSSDFSLSSDKTTCIPKCLAVISNCTTCSNPTTCSICIPGYQVSSSGACTRLCNINNCLICATTKTCSNCQAGLIPINSNTQCNFNCGINRCAKCDSSTTCSQCSSNFLLSSNKDYCYPKCGLKFYFQQGSSSCLLCNNAIKNCQTCSVSSLNVVCNTCNDLYYLSGSGSCEICSAALSNCLLCSSPSICNLCSANYAVNLKTGTCVSTTPLCSISNCKFCINNDPNKCQTCYSGFIISSGNCNAISCFTGQTYDINSESCICAIGSFLTGTFCSPCSAGNCRTCNTAGCTSCNNRYFLSGSACLSCSTNCLTCSSNTNCQTCDYQYKIKDGGCIKTNTNSQSDYTDDNGVVKTVVCPPGCLSCYATKNSITCIELQPGFVQDSNGNIIACNFQCLSCLSSNPTFCTSCYGKSLLVNGDCSGCSDQNALTCYVGGVYSLTCVPSYTAVSGVCKACASYCLSCNLNGPNTCDAGQCIDGYVNLVGTNNCTKCYGGCSTCNPINPGICFSCANSKYMDLATSTCKSCSSNCQTCTSETVCTSCMTNYVISSTKSCIAAIPYPCLTQTDTKCTSCYDKYTLNSASVCVVDVSCSANSTCISCPKQYYLSNKKCLACSSSLNNCDYCDQNKPSSCIKCSSGYYLNNNQCLACVTGCLACISKQYCTQADVGYYLDTNRKGQYTGLFQACDQNCLNCLNSPTECTSCGSNKFLIGSHCFNNAHIKGTLVIKPLASQKTNSGGWYNETDTNGRKNATIYAQTNLIQSSICFTYGCKKRSDLSITSVGQGSIVVQIVTNTYQDPNLSYNNFLTSLDTVGVPSFEKISSSLTPVGFANLQKSEVNLGLILGVTIPLLILLIIVVIFIKIKQQNLDDKQSHDTDKKMEDFQM